MRWNSKKKKKEHNQAKNKPKRPFRESFTGSQPENFCKIQKFLISIHKKGNIHIVLYSKLMFLSIFNIKTE